MSFRCENSSCDIVTPIGQPSNYVVTEKREKIYDVRKKQKDRNFGGQMTKKEKKKNRTNPQGPVYDTRDGWEIVKQIKVCPDCYSSMTGLKPKMVQRVEKTVVQENKKRRFDDKTGYRKKKRFNLQSRPKAKVEFVKRQPQK